MSEHQTRGRTTSRQTPTTLPRETHPRMRRRRRGNVPTATNNSTLDDRRPHHRANNRNRARNKARARRRAKQNSANNRANSIRILQQNVASLKKRETELLNRLSKMDIDLAVIQECNFPAKKDRRTGKISYEIPEIIGWNIVATPRQVGRCSESNSSGRGGVAILIKEGINYEIITEKPITQEDTTTEYVGVRIIPDSGEDPYDIHNLYIPPINQSAREETREQHWNTSKLPSGKNTFIFSDANCHGSWDSRLNSNTMSDDWDEWLLLNNFSTLNTPESYTRVNSKGHKSSPDITVVPNHWLGRMKWSPLIKRPGGSDHLPILVTLKKSIPLNNHNKRRSNKKRHQRTKWAFKKADWVKFRNIVDQCMDNWPPNSEEWSVHKRNNAMCHAITTAAQESIPRGNRTNPKPFWNEELEKKSKESDEARLNAHISSQHADTYVQKRKDFDHACTEEKTKSWRSFVEKIDSKTDPSKVWKTIAGLDGRNSKNKPGVELKSDGDEPTVAKTDKQKAQLFIKTYLNASKPSDELNGRAKKLHEKDTVHKMREATKGCKACGGDKTGICSKITRDELDLALYKSKLGKATGQDQIANEMLKNLSDNGKIELLRLINQSWLEGTCPGPWKSGEIIPLPKPGKDHQITSSFRPICLLSVIGKLQERIIKCRLEQFLESNNKLDPSQAGFRKARSTVEQVGRLTQTIHDGLEEGDKTLVVYVDFSKAYDKVWRTMLLAKMGELGIAGCCTHWVQALLSDRISYVNWYGTKSNKKRFDHGVPQGSVISPLLWLIYINDLVSSMPVAVQIGISSSLFADDLALISKGKSVEECEEKMQPALDCLEAWARDNKMEISITPDEKSKTVACFYTKNYRYESNNKVAPRLKLNGINIFHSLAPKFLGVTIDQTLTFTQHANEKSKMMGKRNSILKSLSGRSWGQKSSDLRSVHITYTQAAAEYAAGAWVPFTAGSTIEKLEVKQREAARIITGCCQDTKNEFLLHEAGLMPISMRADQEAVFLHERNLRLPTDTPARQIAECETPKPRLTKKGADGEVIKPPREKAKAILKEMDMLNINREESLRFSSVDPWEWKYTNINFRNQLKGCTGKHDTKENILNAFQHTIQQVHPSDVVVYSDGSVGANNNNGGAGCIIYWPADMHTEPQVNKEACGRKCSSYIAELKAIDSALTSIEEKIANLPTNSSIWIFTDSESTIKRLQGGPGAQTTKLADRVWMLLSHVSESHNTTLQWIPGHMDIEGNEAADRVAKEASHLEQKDIALDFLTIKSAVKRHFKQRWRAMVVAQEGIYSDALKSKLPATPSHISRKEEVTIHQLRTEKSPLVRSCWARYANKPEEKRLCPNGCNAKEDVKHLFWDCPLYSAQRLKHFGTIYPEKDILFENPDNILKFLRDTGHSTAPAMEEETP